VGGPIPLPDPFDNDISPWLLRRLDLATALPRSCATTRRAFCNT
jgi:hypothetical protein